MSGQDKIEVENRDLMPSSPLENGQDDPGGGGRVVQQNGLSPIQNSLTSPNTPISRGKGPFEDFKWTILD